MQIPTEGTHQSQEQYIEQEEVPRGPNGETLTSV